MGPYCKYCDTRCFTPIPSVVFERMKKLNEEGASLGRIPDIMATCARGQQHDKEACGFCYDDRKTLEQK